LLKSNVSCVALTSDIWSRNAKEDYISVVAHYVNADWVILGSTVYFWAILGSNIFRACLLFPGCIMYFGPYMLFGLFLFSGRPNRARHVYVIMCRATGRRLSPWAGTARPKINIGPGRPEIKRAGLFRAWAGPGWVARMYTYRACLSP
jgi:hypothetical protein